jgi:hypothetical protein
MHVLKEQEVPKEHVFASLTTIDSVTLAHPKPSLTDRELYAPEGWEDRLNISSGTNGWVLDSCRVMSQWGANRSIARVVLIMVGPGVGSSSTLWQGGLDPPFIERLHIRCHQKPMLVVLDFDDSGVFADAAAKATDGEIFFLASGRCRSQKTAAVVCDHPKVLITVAPGTDSLRYAIYSTMFHRSLFDLVVFSSGNPRLIEIAGLLNATSKCRGFEAVLVTRGRVSRRLRLRHFFGAQVVPGRLAGILPVRPEGGFIDDIDHFVRDDTRAALRKLPNEFVQVELHRHNVKLIAWGRFRSDPRWEMLRRHVAYGPGLKPRVKPPVQVEVLVREILCALPIEWIPRDFAAPAPDEEIFERDRVFGAICQYVVSENGCTGEEWECLNDLVPFVHCCSVIEWYKRIRAGLDLLSGDIGWEPEEEEVRDCLDSDDYDDYDDEAETEIPRRRRI